VGKVESGIQRMTRNPAVTNNVGIMCGRCLQNGCVYLAHVCNSFGSHVLGIYEIRTWRKYRTLLEE
jgi:hypothetical protein